MVENKGGKGEKPPPAKAATSPSPSPSPPPSPLSSSSSVWEAAYVRWLAWPEEEGGQRLVPTNYLCDDGYRLGKWQDNQRQAYKKGTLSMERVERYVISW